MNKEVEAIIKTVCEETNITFVELCSKRRSSKFFAKDLFRNDFYHYYIKYN